MESVRCEHSLALPLLQPSHVIDPPASLHLLQCSVQRARDILCSRSMCLFAHVTSKNVRVYDEMIERVNSDKRATALT